MTLKHFFFLLFSPSLLGAAAEITESVEWNGRDLPGQSSPCWVQRVAENGSMDMTPNGLRIVQNPSNWGDVTQARYLFTSPCARDMTIEARVHTLKADKAGAASLGFSNGFREEYATFFPDRIYLHRSKITIPANFQDQFRKVRFEVKNTDLSVFVDSKVLYDGKGIYGAAPPSGSWVARSAQVTFGAVSASAKGESLWENVKAEIRADTAERAGEPPFVKNAEHVVIYRRAGEYTLFPLARIGKDASVYVKAVRKHSDSHMATGGDPIVLRSADGGRTWHEVEEWPFSAAAAGPNDSVIIPAANGWRTDTDPEKRTTLETAGVEVRVSPDNKHYSYAQGYHVDVSRDGGKSWEKHEFDFPGVSLLMNYHEELSFLRINSQILLRAIYSRPTAGGSYYEPYVLRSEDNGETWKVVSIYKSPDGKTGFGETALALAANGDVTAMLREELSTPESHLWVSRSSDNGKTWSEPKETPMIGHPACLTTLRDGRLLCTYGYRANPMGIRAAISFDNGETWDAQNIRKLRTDGYGSGFDNGYPITYELPDGMLLTICYLTDREGVTYIAGTRWKWDGLDSPEPQSHQEKTKL